MAVRNMIARSQRICSEFAHGRTDFLRGWLGRLRAGRHDLAAAQIAALGSPEAWQPSRRDVVACPPLAVVTVLLQLSAKGRPAAVRVCHQH